MANDLDRRFLLGGLAGAAGVSALAAMTGRAAAGPLNPPGGAVASSGKTLGEVEPRIAVNATNTPGDGLSLYRITQPGSYYLTGNIQNVTGKNGISILASGVTLDLNGFEVTGSGTTGTHYNAIGMSGPSQRGVTIRNGTIRNWSGDGVNTTVPTAFDSRVEDITVESCGDQGIVCGYAAVITRCVAANCGGTGIGAFPGSAVSACVTYNCGAPGIGGFSVSAGCVISACSAFSNAGCGIKAYDGVTVTGCACYENAEQGIDAGSGCVVEACTLTDNVLDGVRVDSRCRVAGNTCSGNGGVSGSIGAGVRTVGNSSTVEGNSSTSNTFGYYIQGTGNLVVRNTAGGNTTNWVAVANNVRGPIIDRTAPASPAIVGDSAPSVLGSTDPHANFTV